MMGNFSFMGCRSFTNQKCMKNLLLFIIVFGSISSAFAQTLTLEDAMDQAVNHDYALKNQVLNIAVSQNQLSKTLTRRQPIVNGNGDFRYNPILQTSVIPGDAFGQGGEDQKLRFGTNFNILLGVDANYTLFDPVYETDLALNRAQTALETSTLQKTTAAVRLEAATAYCEALLQQTQVDLAASRLRRAQDLLEVTQTRELAGATLPIEVQKSQLEVQNAQALLTQTQNLLERSRLNLARQMGVTVLSLPPLNNALLEINADTIQIVPLSDLLVINGKPAILEEQQRLEITRLQLQREDKRYLPTVSLYGNLSAQHLSNNLAVWDRWFPFAYIGIQASLPLYDGGLKMRNKEGYQLQTKINQNNLDRLREELTYQLQSATLELKNALSQLEDASKNLQNARAIQNIDQVRFQEGSLLFTDFRNTEFSLRESEANFLASSQNYLLSYLRWLDASGSL